MNAVCKLFGHKTIPLEDSGIQDGTAGGMTGDSFLDGTEEMLTPGEPLRLPQPRPVKHRDVLFVCLRCGVERKVGRYCEIGEEEKLSDASLWALLEEWEKEGYFDD